MCPFKGCGRKFVSDFMLKDHLTRRHGPNDNNTSTPVYVPAKAQNLVKNPVQASAKAPNLVSTSIQNLEKAEKMQSF